MLSNNGSRKSARGTMDTIRHWTACNRIADEWKEKFQTERDRRYSEVNTEREKALKIKEEADKAALGLAREIQTYKDEKANQLREQINSERGTYATKDDLASAIREITVQLTPLIAFMSSSGGALKQYVSTRTNVVAVAAIASALSAVVGMIGTILMMKFAVRY